MKKRIANWGLFPVKECEVLEPFTYAEVSKAILNCDNIIARGNGRCYGDASLGKNVLSTLKLNNIIEFDSTNGVINCQSGVLLSTVLEKIVPQGFFLPITPGTKFITVGGAFSSDIHGKNHHVDGVFSDHVISLKLVNQLGEIIEVFPNDDLFNRTAGGMGSTGIILEVKFSLKKIETSYIRQTSIRAKNLKEIFQLFEENKSFTYSVAWIDCLANKENIGRSVLLLGEHALMSEMSSKNLLAVHKKPFIRIPIYFPSWFLSSLFIRLFNTVYYHKPSSNIKTGFSHYDEYFYPLDKINDWNKIYGKNGFVQYQFVIPKEKSYEGVKRILEILSKNQLGSFLAVLKLFGKSHDDRYLHFPIEGYTLAVDIKISKKIWSILNQIDEIVTGLGGKIYLTKDARLSKKMYQHQYGEKIIQNHKFISDQMIRLNQEKKNVFLIIGANSDIAKETALAYIKKYPEAYLLLASRDTDSLKRFVSENSLEGKAEILFYDVEQYSEAKPFVETLPMKPSVIMYAAGILVENEECSTDTQRWIKNTAVNYTGAVAIINELVNDNNPFLERVIGMSSIAGLRGRKSNFMYGSAKAGFHQYLFGLNQQLESRRIIVQAVTPGFVKTKMTQTLKLPKNAVNPADIAKVIMKESKKFEVFPNVFWAIIGSVVRYGPPFIIKKL